jgi:hypothetical protein
MQFGGGLSVTYQTKTAIKTEPKTERKNDEIFLWMLLNYSRLCLDRWGRSLDRYDDGLQRANTHGFADSARRMTNLRSGHEETRKLWLSATVG